MLKEEDWYKNLPGTVKEAVDNTPPIFLYVRKYSSGEWMVTGYTENDPPNPIIEPKEKAGKSKIKTHASIVKPSALTAICWSCKEITPEEELLENDSWCESCNKNSKEDDG